MLGNLKYLIQLAKDEHYKRAVVTIFILAFFCGHIAPTLLLLLLLSTALAPLVVVYLSWVLVFDWKSPATGWLWPFSLRRSHYCRSARLFNYFRDFFPVKLVKTAELDPAKNYILAYHPHGVLAVGVFVNFATEATGCSQLFPGISIWPMTMPIVFSAPVSREWLMLLGVRSVTSRGCRSILAKGPGHSVTIVPGGTREMLEAQPKALKIAIRKKKGFIRLALETGSPVVPVYGFGENDLFDQPKSSLLRRFQRYCTQTFGMSFPFYQGKELAGMLPHRTPLTTVVGKPLAMPHVEYPSAEQVDKWHAIYLDELSALFNEHKLDHGYTSEQNLEFF